MSVSYAEFLDTKTLVAPQVGLANTPDLPEHLFPFQRECVAFGLRVGSWGCFLNTGLGKTLCELAWSEQALAATNGKALILTPLAVARQIEAEGKRFDYPVRVIRSQSEAREGINVCNYDRLHLLEPDAFGAVALDEASILKHFIGAQSRELITQFSGHRFRMAATATPAPNDHTELAQHAAFLDVMTRDEMLVRWFINDSNDTGSWRLKGHAVEPFFDWMSSWARMAEHPRDLGDDTPGFDLPPLRIVRHQAVEPETPISGGLFGGDVSATGMFTLKRHTSEARAECIVKVIFKSWEDGECSKPASGSPKHANKKTNSTRSAEPNSRTQPQTTGEAFSSTESEPKTTRRGSGSNRSDTATGSKSKTTSPCSTFKTERARSAEVVSQEAMGDSTLTTATNPTASEDYSAITATSLLDSSGKILRISTELSITSETQTLTPWILWCDTNEEQSILEQKLGRFCLSVRGSQSADEKERLVQAWLDGERPVLLTKPSIAGYGMNFQRCHLMAFVGRTFSYELWFQAVRRCWRFGQLRPVQVHLVVAEGEDAIGRVLDRKADDHSKLNAEMKAAMQRAIGRESIRRVAYRPNYIGHLPTWMERT